jgi:hypothetical protein
LRPSMATIEPSPNQMVLWTLVLSSEKAMWSPVMWFVMPMSRIQRVLPPPPIYVSRTNSRFSLRWIFDVEVGATFAGGSLVPLVKARTMSAIGSGSSANTHHVLPPPSIWMVSPSLALSDAISANDDGFVEDGCIGVPCSPFLQWAHCNTPSTSGPAVLTHDSPLRPHIIPTY